MKKQTKTLMTLITIAFLGTSCHSDESLSILSSSFSSSYIPSTNNFYMNPVHPIVNNVKMETYLADPFVVRDDDGIYYMYTTQSNVFSGGASREFVRGPVFESVDLINWKYKANVFTSYTPSWGTSGAGVWAPTVIKVNDTWNYYYSFSTGGDPNPGIGVATSSTPYGPWIHYGKLFNSLEIGVTNSIDPYVFYDDDILYMAWGSFGGLITLVELEDDGLTLKGGLETQYEEKVAIAGYELNESKNYEAVFILKHDGYYYMFLSTGTCCSGAQSTYHVVVAKSETLKGPYLDSKGRGMFGPSRGDYVVVPTSTGVMGVGHMSLIEDDADELWMIYHGYDTKGTIPNWRVIYVDRIIFDEVTGMPKVEGSKATNHVEMPGPYINSLEG
jgi:arabinan endo-1,5-alpha-L-arabinosidase